MPTPAYYQEVYDAAKRLAGRGEKSTYKAIAAESGWCLFTVWKVISHFRSRDAWPFEGGQRNQRVDPLAKREAVKMYQAGVPIKQVHRHLSKRYRISFSLVVQVCERPMKPRRTEAERLEEERQVQEAAGRIKQRGERVSYQSIANELGWGRSVARRVGYQLRDKGSPVVNVNPKQRAKQKKIGSRFERLTPTEIRERAAQIRAERRD